MPNYFYTDTNGQKRGPVDDQQLQVLVDQRIITPHTPLETEAGVKGLAGQIPGLRFPSSVPSPPELGAKLKNVAEQVSDLGSRSYGQLTSRSSLFAWLLDFGFRNIQLPVINLWLSKIVYAICCILTGLAAVVTPLVLFFLMFANVSSVSDVGTSAVGIAFLTLALWFALVINLMMIRLALEWFLMIVDWVVETTKAARLLIDEQGKEK